MTATSWAGLSEYARVSHLGGIRGSGDVFERDFTNGPEEPVWQCGSVPNEAHKTPSRKTCYNIELWRDHSTYLELEVFMVRTCHRLIASVRATTFERRPTTSPDYYSFWEDGVFRRRR